MTRHDTGSVHWRVAGVREQEVSDRNWRRGCDAEEEKSSGLPKQDIEGSEVQKIGRP